MDNWWPINWLKQQFEALQDERANASGTFAKVAFYALVLMAGIFGAAFFLKRDSAGQFGDFIGGVLNPILTFITFVAVLVTIILQRYELIETRNELREGRVIAEQQEKNSRRQLFENTFFQMLSFKSDILKSIIIPEPYSGNRNKQGADGIEIILRDVREEYTQLLANFSGDDRLNFLITVYEKYYEIYSSDLGHYFRYIYRFVRYIDESDFCDGVYIKILRASFSDPELTLLMLNGLSKGGIRFRPLIEKYALLDNVPQSAIVELCAKRYQPAAFGI